MKKKTKKKTNKGSLLLISFLLIFLSYFDFKTDKENITLIAEKTSIYTNVNANELLNILDNERGIILIVDDKLQIKEYVNLLTEINNDEKIYVYNCKNDQVILTKEDNEIVLIQEQSEDYKKLVERLGFYTDVYKIDDEYTEYYKIETPMVMFIKDGTIEYSYYIAEDNLTKEDLSNIYLVGFNILKED